MEVLQSLVPMTMGFNNKPCLFSLFSIIFHNGLFLAKLWQNGGGAVLPDVLEIQPVGSSHFQPFAD